MRKRNIGLARLAYPQGASAAFPAVGRLLAYQPNLSNSDGKGQIKFMNYKKCIFIQNYGTYSNEILVMAGITNKQEVFRFLKKNKVKVDISKWILNDFNEWKEAIEKKHKGLFCWNEECYATVLFLRKPEDTWDYWESLLHECHHIVQQMASEKMMLKEMDAQAYLFEYLFRSIRRKLLKLDKI